MAATGHHLEVMMATCHQPGFCWRGCRNLFPSAEKHMHCVGPGSLRGSDHSGPSSASQAETGHHLKIISFTWYCGEKIIQRFQQVWKEYGVILTGATSAVCS